MSAALNDFLLKKEMDAVSAVDKYFSPDYRHCVNGRVAAEGPRDRDCGQPVVAANGPPVPKASRAKFSPMRRCPAGSGWTSSGSGSSA